jgi:hypothetical protein
MRLVRTGRLALAGAIAIGCASCGHPGAVPRLGQPGVTAIAPDSVTLALWRFDEAGGTRAADAGPFRLEATAGTGTTTDFGRIGSARRFTRSIESFVFAPFNPVLESRGGLSVDAWIYVNAYGQYEDTPIAGRWSQEANQQGWLFGVLGRNLLPPIAQLPSPGFHSSLLLRGSVGQLLFAYQPDDANAPRGFTSSRLIELQRWTHVAATFDGEVVKFYINGELDSQFATQGRIRSTEAPVLVGNYFDTRRLSRFGGDLRVDVVGDNNPYYAFEGFIDELRLSSTARTTF